MHREAYKWPSGFEERSAAHGQIPMSFTSGQLGQASESTVAVAELRLLRGSWKSHSRMANSYKASSPRAPKPDMVMEPSYSYPQDDYALNILTQAAMHTTSNNNSEISHSRSGYDSNPTSGLTTADFHGAGAELRDASEITNHQLEAHPGHREIQSSGSSLTPELPNNYNHLVLPHSAAGSRMETLAFNPAQAGRHNTFMDSAFRGIGSEISRNYANNLGILNAESYSDHVSPGRFDARPADNTLAFGMIPHHQMDHSSREEDDEIDMGTRRRKKPRIEAKSDDDDEKKKSRGRPRVDTKDETAADVSDGLLLNIFQSVDRSLVSTFVLTVFSVVGHRYGWLKEPTVTAKKLPSLPSKSRSKS